MLLKLNNKYAKYLIKYSYIVIILTISGLFAGLAFSVQFAKDRYSASALTYCVRDRNEEATAMPDSFYQELLAGSEMAYDLTRMLTSEELFLSFRNELAGQIPWIADKGVTASNLIRVKQDSRNMRITVTCDNAKDAVYLANFFVRQLQDISRQAYGTNFVTVISLANSDIAADRTERYFYIALGTAIGMIFGVIIDIILTSLAYNRALIREAQKIVDNSYFNAPPDDLLHNRYK